MDEYELSLVFNFPFNCLSESVNFKLKYALLQYSGSYLKVTSL